MLRMDTIKNTLMWLDASLDIHGEEAYLKRLQQTEKDAQTPRWQRIINEGSAEELKDFFKQIASLEKEEQQIIFKLPSADKLNFLCYLAANGDQDSLQTFFNILVTFPKRDQQTIICYENAYVETSFIKSLTENSLQSLALKPLLDFIDSISAFDRVYYFGSTMPFYIVQNQKTALNNGFDRFLQSWQKLLKDIHKVDIRYTNQQLIKDMIGGKSNYKDFYKMVIDFQPIAVVLEFITLNLIPLQHIRYFYPVKETLWQHILTLPRSEQRHLLQDVFVQGEPLFHLFCDTKGLGGMIMNPLWQRKINKHLQNFFLQSEVIEEGSSYSEMMRGPTMISVIEVEPEMITTPIIYPQASAPSAHLFNKSQDKEENIQQIASELPSWY